MNIPYQKVRYRHLTAIMFLVFIITGIGLLFWPYFQWLWDSWRGDPLNTFGYLAPPVFVWVIYHRRKDILAENISPWLPGWIFFLTGLILSLLFYWNGQAFLACLGMPFLVYGLSLIFLGRDIGRYLVFPIFFLLFLYPWGNLLDFLFGYDLRRLSLFMSYMFFRVIDSKAAISGTYLFTGRFLVDIAPACSGLAIMNVLLFLGAIGVYLYNGSMAGRLLIWSSIIPIAIFMNSIRVILTGLTGHLLGSEAAIAFYDNMSGMIIFGIAMLLLYSETRLLKKLKGKDRKQNDKGKC